MLLELSIKDFAIIDSLHLRLNRLFNVFTGETGAGKSIIIDAVNALLGGKIGAEFVRAGTLRASVEGIFAIKPLPPIKATWQPYEAALDGDDGATNLLEAIDHAESRARALVEDAESADASVALATLLHHYDIIPEDGQLILAAAGGELAGRYSRAERAYEPSAARTACKFSGPLC